jgi:hypothetical protein
MNKRTAPRRDNSPLKVGALTGATGVAVGVEVGVGARRAGTVAVGVGVGVGRGGTVSVAVEVAVGIAVGVAFKPNVECRDVTPNEEPPPRGERGESDPERAGTSSSQRKSGGQYQSSHISMLRTDPD